MNEIIDIDINTYNDLYGLPTLHPLVAMIDMTQATKMVNHVRMRYEAYALFLKNDAACRLKYGRRYYDYQEGTIVSIAPGQMVEVEHNDEHRKPNVYGLLFHPDLIYGTPLAKKMHQYSFFDYDQAEALHLSEKERDIIKDCFQKITFELNNPVDSHSRELLCMHIELVLEYCLRFYDRQFCTRAKANNDILTRFEGLLNEYFSTDQPKHHGLPSVKYFADKIYLSPGYFGDVIKKETGHTAQEHIQHKIIALSKDRLMDPGEQISEVAYSLGFQYPQHFIRLFKRQVGQTPGQWRAHRA